MTADLVEYALRLGDDALVAAQRLAEWCSRAPELEEDVALTNIALDQLGVARLLLSYAGELENQGRDEDALAYLRSDREYRNCLLVELDNGDFGVTMAKLLFLSAYQKLLYDWLVGSTDGRLAGIAAKARKESAYHLDHSALWTVRLGDGTEESRRRMQRAVDLVWPYTHELFESDDLTRRLDAAGIAADPAALRLQWTSTVDLVLADATLTRPEAGPGGPDNGGPDNGGPDNGGPDNGWAPTGGRQGRHTEALSYLLGELQVLHRAHPGAIW